MYITSFTLQYLLTCNLSLRCPWNKVEIGILYYFTGKDGKETSKVTLHKFFHKDFERSETDTYKVEEEDVGDVVMVTLINHVGFRSDWLAQKLLWKKKFQADLKNTNSLVIAGSFVNWWFMKEKVHDENWTGALFMK